MKARLARARRSIGERDVLISRTRLAGGSLHEANTGPFPAFGQGTPVIAAAAQRIDATARH